jgi:hypothetical protein
VLPSAEIDDKVDTTIIGQRPIDLVPQQRYPAGEEKFSGRTERQMAGRARTQGWLILGVHYAITATCAPDQKS